MLKLSSRKSYCTGRPCYQMYCKHLLEIEQKGDSVRAQKLAPGDSMKELATCASIPCPKTTPCDNSGGDVGTQQLETSDVAAFAPPRSANTPPATLSGSSVLVPRPPPAPPLLLPPASQDNAEVFGLIHSVLMQLTNLQQEIKQVSYDIQQLKDQVRALKVRTSSCSVHEDSQQSYFRK